MSLTIELQSLIDTHEKPFIVIDKFYNIVGVNKAFTTTYKTTSTNVIGQPCFQISHKRNRPCSEYGEACPYHQIFNDHQLQSCLHVHNDANGNQHRVRVNAYPLKGLDNELYLGEMVTEIHTEQESSDNGVSMVGVSPAFLFMIEQLLFAAQSDAPTLLQGETGTGKELAASFLHEQSLRQGEPFLTLDCTVLTEGLFESEVFGYEKGAFTGSHGKKTGLFELAHGGTLFLDEIGELPLLMQAKLLRVLESGEFRRIGGTKCLTADFRVVCATNRDLLREVRSGRFREDLYYRLAGIMINLPSLNERQEDIPLIAHTLLNRINQTRNSHFSLTDQASSWLQQRHFPGNIRELRNLLSAVVTTTNNNQIDIDSLQKVALPLKHHLPIQKVPHEIALQQTKEELVPSGQMSLSEIEKQQMNRLLQKFSGNRKKVAETLGISVRTLYRKLKKHELK